MSPRIECLCGAWVRIPGDEPEVQCECGRMISAGSISLDDEDGDDLYGFMTVEDRDEWVDSL